MKSKRSKGQSPIAQLQLELSTRPEDSRTVVSMGPPAGTKNAASVLSKVESKDSVAKSEATVTSLSSVRSDRVRDILIRDLMRTRVPAKQA